MTRCLLQVGKGAPSTVFWFNPPRRSSSATRLTSSVLRLEVDTGLFLHFEPSELCPRLLRGAHHAYACEPAKHLRVARLNEQAIGAPHLSSHLLSQSSILHPCPLQTLPSLPSWVSLPIIGFCCVARSRVVNTKALWHNPKLPLLGTGRLTSRMRQARDGVPHLLTVIARILKNEAS